MHRPVLLTLLTTVSIYPRNRISPPAQERTSKEGGTHIVRLNRPQINQLDAQSTQVHWDVVRDVLPGVLEHMQRRLDRVQRRTVRDDREVRSFLHHLGGREGELEVADGDLFDGGAVENFGF